MRIIEVKHHLELGGGATGEVTDTSPPMEVTPADVPAIVARQFGRTDFRPTDAPPGALAAWWATNARGLPAFVVLRKVGASERSAGSGGCSGQTKPML